MTDPTTLPRIENGKLIPPEGDNSFYDYLNSPSVNERTATSAEGAAICIAMSGSDDPFINSPQDNELIRAGDDPPVYFFLAVLDDDIVLVALDDGTGTWSIVTENAWTRTGSGYMVRIFADRASAKVALDEDEVLIVGTDVAVGWRGAIVSREALDGVDPVDLITHNARARGVLGVPEEGTAPNLFFESGTEFVDAEIVAASARPFVRQSSDTTPLLVYMMVTQDGIFLVFVMRDTEYSYLLAARTFGLKDFPLLVWDDPNAINRDDLD